MAGFIGKLREDLRRVKADEIARRYLVLNAFDGALATLGIVAGAYFAGTTSVKVIIVAGLGASAAMGISGSWGAYFTERAERRRSLKELERALFTNLSGSSIEQASKTAVAMIAVIDGLSPLLVSLLCLSPLLLSFAGLLTLSLGVYAASGIAVAVLFSLGMFLGRISETSVWVHGALMMLAGGSVFLLVYVLGG